MKISYDQMFTRLQRFRSNHPGFKVFWDEVDFADDSKVVRIHFTKAPDPVWPAPTGERVSYIWCVRTDETPHPHQLHLQSRVGSDSRPATETETRIHNVCFTCNYLNHFLGDSGLEQRRD